MRQILLLAVVASFGSRAARTQDFVDRVDLKNPASLSADTVGVDSLPKPLAHRLLPQNMSFMERGLWDENGLFRSIGLASPLTPETRKSELGLRRTMLTVHQIGGFVTLALMVTAVYYGQQSLNYNGGSRTVANTYQNRHQLFVTATIASYATTGLLAVLSPPPLIRRDETSTTTIHKTLAWVHFAGMILTPILGATLHRRMTNLAQAHFHQVSAYVTTATFAASMIVVTF